MNIQFIPSANCSPVGRHYINILTMENDPGYLRYGYKKRRGSKVSPRLSHCSGLSIAPWKG